MNNYLKISIVAFILLVFSMINEKRNTEYLNVHPNQYDYINIFIIRYLHFCFYLFITFYLFFFNGIGNSFDVYLFLFSVLFAVVGWCVCGCCWFSYLELLFYDTEKTQNICTTFHACFHSIFFGDIFITISGLLLFFNVNYVLFYFDKLNIKYRILYFIVFLSLFIHSIIEGRLNKKYYDPEKNDILNGMKKMLISITV